jgi:hypothetical protein
MRRNVATALLTLVRVLRGGARATGLDRGVPLHVGAGCGRLQRDPEKSSKVRNGILAIAVLFHLCCMV